MWMLIYRVYRLYEEFMQFLTYFLFKTLVFVIYSRDSDDQFIFNNEPVTQTVTNCVTVHRSLTGSLSSFCT